MCSVTICKRCGQTTWKGCGKHIEQVLAGVPQSKRCTCREEAASAPANGGFFARLRAK